MQTASEAVPVGGERPSWASRQIKEMCADVPASIRSRLALLVRWVHKGGWEVLDRSTAALQLCRGLVHARDDFCLVRVRVRIFAMTRSSMSLKAQAKGVIPLSCFQRYHRYQAILQSP